MPFTTLIVCNFNCLLYPLVDHFPLTVITVYLVVPLSLISYDLLFPIVCHSPLSIIHHCLSFTIIYHSPLFVIWYCLSFLIVSHSSLSIIPNCLFPPPPLSVIPFVCNHPLAAFSCTVLPNCLASSFILYFPLSYISYCI